jgi:hypothetical protein
VQTVGANGLGQFLGCLAVIEVNEGVVQARA